MMAARAFRAVETFEFQCHACHRLVELAVALVLNNWGRCPRCDSRIEICWREAQA